MAKFHTINWSWRDVEPGDSVIAPGTQFIKMNSTDDRITVTAGRRALLVLAKINHNDACGRDYFCYSKFIVLSSSKGLLYNLFFVGD
jgi:hypothetical protein